MNKQQETEAPVSRAKAFLDKALGDSDNPEQEAPETTPDTISPPPEASPTPPPVKDEEVKEESVNETEFRTPFDKAKDAASEKVPDADAPPEEADYDAETERQIEEMEKAPHPGEAFRKLRKEKKELQDQLKAYTSGDVKPEGVAELEARASEAEALAQKNQELQTRLAELDYRHSEEYKQAVDQPFIDIAELATTLDERNGLDADTIIKAITKPDYEAQSLAIEELKSKVDPRTFNTISQMADQVITLFRREEQIKANASEMLSTAKEREAAQQIVQRDQAAREFKTGVESTFDTYSDKIPIFIADDGTTNDTFSKLKGQASELTFDEMSVEDKAFAALSSVSIGPLIRKYNEITRELTKLRMSNNNSDRATLPPPESDSPQQDQGARTLVQDRDFGGFVKRTLDRASFG